MSAGGWLGVDLDGTLARYDGWVNELHIGEPIAPMVERVKAWIAAGVRVKIVTARVAPGSQVNNDGSKRDIEAVRRVISAWCGAHLGVALEVTHEKDFGMIELWDDRVVQVETNTGRPVVGSMSRMWP